MKTPLLPPPGQDPVKDHGYCCAHPELWRYFREEDSARMLSALGAIFRVDPVETEFLLDLTGWAAGPEAAPVLERVRASGDVAPKLEGRAAAQLERLGVAPEHEATLPLDEPVAALLARLHRTEGASARAAIAEELYRRAHAGESEGRIFDIACELLGEGHPEGPALLAPQVRGVDRSGLTDEQRASALLACAASGLDEALELLLDIVLSPDPRPIDVDDLYEATKALVTHPPPALDKARRLLLADGMHRHVRRREGRDPGRRIVIDALLRGREALPRVTLAAMVLTVRPVTRGERTAWRRSIAEALGAIDTRSSSWQLTRLALSNDRSVRAEAMRSLRNIGTEQAAQAALRALRPMVWGLRPAIDIDAAEAMHTALDLFEHTHYTGAARLLTRMLALRELDAHGVQARAALTLAELDDERCMRLHPGSKLPHLVHALLMPQPVTPGRRRDKEMVAFERGARWLEKRWGTELLTDAPTWHLRRVLTSRRIIRHCDAS